MPAPWSADDAHARVQATAGPLDGTGDWAMQKRRRVLGALGTLGAALATMTMVAPAVDAAPPVKLVLGGLVSPKGLTISTDGNNPVVAQGGFFGGGPVLEVTTRHGHSQTIELTDDVALTDLASGPDGTGWAIGP